AAKPVTRHCCALPPSCSCRGWSAPWRRSSSALDRVGGPAGHACLAGALLAFRLNFAWPPVSPWLAGLLACWLATFWFTGLPSAALPGHRLPVTGLPGCPPECRQLASRAPLDGQGPAPGHGRRRGAGRFVGRDPHGALQQLDIGFVLARHMRVFEKDD